MILTDEQRAAALQFYTEILDLLQECDVEYMLGGGFAMAHYTGIQRDTKDLDIFCRSHDYPKLLKFFAAHGYETELYDVRWLAKVRKGEHFMDIIFSTVNNICRVDDSWFAHAAEGEFAGRKVKFLSAEELIWCKCYVHNRERYDGADVNHVLLKYGEQLNWKRLLDRLDPHWHLLLAHIILFQFVYPFDFPRIIPRWLFDELMGRAAEQYELPAQGERVCRGPVIDNTQYAVDVKEWDYKAYTIISV
jgi:hypothetical protein